MYFFISVYTPSILQAADTQIIDVIQKSETKTNFEFFCYRFKVIALRKCGIETDKT